MNQAYIGADPGLSGAIAVYVPPLPMTAGGPYVEVHDMPVNKIDGKKHIDLWRLADIAKQWAKSHEVKVALVESVHSMPGQGVASMFKFGFSAGALQQAIVSAGLPMTLITPASWKAILGLRGGAENKHLSRELASRLFPTYAYLWAREKDDGRAEAVLLAYYGSKLP